MVTDADASILVFSLQMKVDLVGAFAAEHVLDREAPLDLALAGFVGLAIERGFRGRVVAPRPFDRRTVVLLEIVRAALELAGQDHAKRSDADRRLRTQR